MSIKEMIFDNELHDKTEMMKLLNEHWCLNDCMPPLFHGSDESVLSLNEIERTEIKNHLEIIIETIESLFKKNNIGITNKILMNSRDSHGRSATAYVYATARKNNSPLYSYNNFYVTNGLERAIEFSKISTVLGETGWVAERMILGAEALGIELPNNSSFMKAMETYYNRKELIKKPVVVMLLDGKVSDFSRENGDEFIIDSFYEMIKTKETILNLRMKNQLSFKDRVYLIKEKYYDDLREAWNNV